MISYSMSEPICTEQPFSCAAMRNGVIFRLITTSPTNNHGGFAADDLRSPRQLVEKGPRPTTSDHPWLRSSRSVGLHGSGFSDRNPFCICAGRADGVDGRHNDQVKGGRVPGFPHPVEPAGGTRGPANRKLTGVCMATVRDPSGRSTRLTGRLVPQEERRRHATRPHFSRRRGVTRPFLRRET